MSKSGITLASAKVKRSLFGNLDSIKEIQLAKPGYGEGSFIVIKATKK